MILARLEEADRYVSLHPDFAAAVAFLRGRRLADLPPGRTELSAAMHAVVSKAPLRRRSEARLEAHRRYMDIHYVISGVEEMGWRSTSHCQHPLGDLDPANDIQFYTDEPANYLTVRPGEFAVFLPEDAHAPLIGSSEVHKVVVKVPV